MNQDFFCPSNLRNFLKISGFTQEAFASFCDVQPRTVARWTKDGRTAKIRCRHRRKIEEFYDLHVKDSPPTTFEYQRTIEDLRRTNEVVVAQLKAAEGEVQDLRIEKRLLEKKLEYLRWHYDRIGQCITMKLKALVMPPLLSSQALYAKFDARMLTRSTPRQNEKPSETDLQTAS